MAYYAYLTSIYNFLAKPSALGCPVTCIQPAFDINVKYFHENAFIQVEEKVINQGLNVEHVTLKYTYLVDITSQLLRIIRKLYNFHRIHIKSKYSTSKCSIQLLMLKNMWRS